MIRVNILFEFNRQSTTHAAHLRVSLITVQMCGMCWRLLCLQRMRSVCAVFFAGGGISKAGMPAFQFVATREREKSQGVFLIVA